jgi:hypothetical protein
MSIFAADFEPAHMDGRRRSPRAPVSFDARLGGQGGLGRTLCKVVDLSLHGCRLQTYSAMKKGQTIWLNLPTIGPVAANIMWADDYLAGCQFQTPLNEDAFTALTQRYA